MYLSTLENAERAGKVRVELRFCTKCNTDMPLRAKHCRDCGRCVGTYDHHCPWTGNCVGERNKRFFYLFICLQLGQLALSLWTSCKLWAGKQAFESTILVILFVIQAGFGFFVLNLFVFHTYLNWNNMTTWECLSWSKISYLKQWPRRLGSPFDLGLK